MNDMISRQDVIDACKSVADNINSPTDQQIGAEYCLDLINKIPSTRLAHKAPISCEEQLSLDCSFCRQHECGDTLYESVDWDGGVGFDYIRDIRFCPICGRELYGYEDEERRGNE